jgi:hypothetical protein
MKNKNKKEKGKIRSSTLFLLLLLFMALTHPIIPDVFYIPIALFIFILARRKEWIKPFKAIDFLLIMIYLVMAAGILIYFQILTLTKVSWFHIIILGFAADIIATILGHIPIIGDFISGMINFIIPMIVVGGLAGVMMGMTLMMISMIPGPSYGANTIGLIVFKAISLII